MERLLDEPEVERAILAYLAERPDAMDTFDGISLWWVRMRHIRFELEILRSVLDRLIDRGVLERVESRASVRYRLKIR
jgi:hypothetical protein